MLKKTDSEIIMETIMALRSFHESTLTHLKIEEEI